MSLKNGNFEFFVMLQWCYFSQGYICCSRCSDGCRSGNP